jgi:hypothetical protein
LSNNQLTISYNYPLITIYKLVSIMLTSLPNLKVVAAVNSVVTTAFSGILFDFFYYNYGSDYITEPSRDTIVGSINGLGI